jgi:hypothetical protein
MKSSNPVYHCVLSTLCESEPKIGDMDEGVVERGKNAGNAKDVFTCNRDISCDFLTIEAVDIDHRGFVARG